MSLNLSRPGPSADRASRRAYWQQRRNALDAQEKANSDRQLGRTLDARLRTLLNQHGTGSPLVVGVYWPIRSEPDLRGLWNDWLRESAEQREVQLALPQVQGRGQPLRFLPWDAGACLLAGPYGACLPETTRPELLPDLLIVPCLAFKPTPVGVVRLGYGGGFYDRTLAQRNCQTWGLAYGWQQDDDLQAEAHDYLLDAVVAA